MKVFVDTNILLDVLAKREPFYRESVLIWTLSEEEKIKGFISTVSFTNIYYIVRKLHAHETAIRALNWLRASFRPVALDERILNQAIDAGFRDFEDAVQYYSAIHAGARCLVTRDTAHFPKDDLSVLSPSEFLAASSWA